jgi:hypothetical protein
LDQQSLVDLWIYPYQRHVIGIQVIFRRLVLQLVLQVLSAPEIQAKALAVVEPPLLTPALQHQD